MRIHIFVLQVNGDVTARQQYDSETAKNNPPARRLVQEFSTVLQERFADNPEKWGRFYFPPEEAARYRWRWEQFNPLSALCLMTIAGKPVGTCLYVYGFDPLQDAAVVELMQSIMVKWQDSITIGPGFGLRKITERPAIISIPYPNTGIKENDERTVSNLMHCLGIAFFEQAAAFIDQADGL